MSNYNEYSKKRLLTNLEKKFNTTIIGSLAAFEEKFGDLWGHGLAYRDLTDDQQMFRKLWQEVRTSILDAGNSNLRAAQSELAQYTFSWNRYVTHFKLQESIGENNGE
jgi:hypothetical protein